MLNYLRVDLSSQIWAGMETNMKHVGKDKGWDQEKKHMVFDCHVSGENTVFFKKNQTNPVK